MNLNSNSITKSQIKFGFTFLIWVLLLACKENGYNQNLQHFNSNYTIIEGSDESISIDTLTTKNIFTSELLYKTHNSENEIYLSDEKFCNLYLISENEDLSIKNSFKNSYNPHIDQCLHSFDQSEDTTFLFYSHPFKVAKFLKDSLLKISAPEVELHANHFLPARKLPTNHFIIPTAENIMKDPTYYRNNFDIRNLANYMKNQNLFTIIDQEGKIIKRFGEFPDIYYEEGINYLSPLPYYYSITDNDIFVSFPISNQIYRYDLTGNLKDSLSIDLKGFEYPDKEASEKSLVPCIDGFSVEQNENGFIFYFKTFSNQEPYHTFYKIDQTEKSVTIFNTNQFNNVGLLLSQTYNNQLKFLHISWDEEPIKISTLIF